MNTPTTADQDALRVANRYAGLIEKATTLQARAGACLDAAELYRRDARANQESAQNHRMAAQSIRDPSVAHEHAAAAREAEAEAAREILAARYYQAAASSDQSEADNMMTLPEASMNVRRTELPAAGPGADGPGPATVVVPAQRSGRYDPDQPRAADGKWIKVEDVLGYADEESCYATDRVTGIGPVPTDLALMEYPPEPGAQAGAFVSVATPKNGYNPVTGTEDDGSLYCAPQLDPGEAETAAKRLEELAAMAESGYRPPAPTKHTRARQRVELLLAENRAAGRDRITVGDQEDFPLTTAELLKLLSEADPTLSAPQTRHAVRAHAAAAAGGEDGTVWLDMEPDTTGTMQVVVTAVQSVDSPDEEDNRQYAARHTPDSARELAGKLRAFARAARRRGEH